MIVWGLKPIPPERVLWVEVGGNVWMTYLDVDGWRKYRTFLNDSVEGRYQEGEYVG